MTRDLIDQAPWELGALRQYHDDSAALKELLMRMAGEGRGVSSRRLGKWLAKIVGRVVDGMRLTKAAGHAHTVFFSVEPTEPAAVPTSAVSN